MLQRSEAGIALRPDLLVAIARCWILIAGLYYVADLFGQLKVGLTDGSDRPFGDDFINTWSGAVLAWRYGGSIVYDWFAYHAFQERFVGASIGFYHYSYPPVLLLVTAPLALVPYVPALALWLWAGCFAFWRALTLAMSQGGAVLLAFATPAMLLNMIAGQNGAWTAALLGGGLCILDRRPILAGILLGLIAYKPHLGVLIPIALLAGRQWTALFAAGATVTLLVVASWALLGGDTWAAYLRNAAVLRSEILEDGSGVWHRMVSVFVFARRLGADVPMAYAVQAAIGIAAAFIVAIAWRRSVTPALRNALLVLGTFLATPYLQDYDLVVGAFVVAWLTTSAKPEAARRAFTASAFVLAVPAVTGIFGMWTGFAIGPIFLVPAFALAVLIAKSAEASRSEGTRPDEFDPRAVSPSLDRGEFVCVRAEPKDGVRSRVNP